ncbi:MAG: hypothetical protein QNJ72_32125 [Pleurocapsa sp. MO_226.B13]|nr:hypothetical protein [Pleurocapsa sp. MO_226.B13]
MVIFLKPYFTSYLAPRSYLYLTQLSSIPLANYRSIFSPDRAIALGKTTFANI